MRWLWTTVNRTQQKRRKRNIEPCGQYGKQWHFFEAKYDLEPRYEIIWITLITLI